MFDRGFTEADIHPIEALPEVWEDTCPLRFISSADLSVHYVEQCQAAQVSWEAALVGRLGSPPYRSFRI